MTRALAVLILSGAAMLRADLNAIRAEPKPERRAKLAMDYANEEYDVAREAYEKGDTTKTGAALAEMQLAVETTKTALNETGKDPRKHSRPFKAAETATRDLLRRLTGFQSSMEFDDRKLIEGPKNRVEEIHDEWVQDIVTGRH